jgi:hypothetical protein
MFWTLVVFSWIVPLIVYENRAIPPSLEAAPMLLRAWTCNFSSPRCTTRTSGLARSMWARQPTWCFCTIHHHGKVVWWPSGGRECPWRAFKERYSGVSRTQCGSEHSGAAKLQSSRSSDDIRLLSKSSTTHKDLEKPSFTVICGASDAMKASLPRLDQLPVHAPRGRVRRSKVLNCAHQIWGYLGVR